MMVIQNPLFLRTRNHVQAAVFMRGIHQRNPHRDDGVGIGIRPIAFILMPRNRSGRHFRNLGPNVVYRIGKKFRADERFHRSHNFSIRHEDEVAGYAVAPATPILQKIFIRQTIKQARQPRGKRLIFQLIFNFAVTEQLVGNLVDLLGHGRAGGSHIGIRQQIFDHEITFAVIVFNLFGSQGAALGVAFHHQSFHSC